MKKNILLSLLVCFVCLLSSCSKEHEHTFKSSWSYDESNHWHEASCEHVSEKNGLEAHNWVKGEMVGPSCEVKGKQVYKCICGATKEEEIAAIGHSWTEADCDTPKTCNKCNATEGTSLGHDWVDATYENPKTCEKCGLTEGEPLPIPPFAFPELATFITPNAYASPVKNKWEYQATLQGDTVYFYVIQHFGSESENSDTVDLSLNHILINTEIGDFVLCSNGAFEVKDQVNVSSIEYFVDTTKDSKTEYYLKVKLDSNFESDLAVNIYSFDSVNKKIYGDSDVYEFKNNICYHTHFANKLYIGNKIKIKPETLYKTPINNQSPSPEKWGYDMQSSKEGIYIYVYQNVEQVVIKPGQDWTATHIEFSIFHHSFGVGAQTRTLAETYVAVWPTQMYYINNSTNVLAVDVESTTFTNNSVEYRLFIRFNNNLENPQDGPYAFIKPRLFDPKDNNQPYSANDVIEYRDERFVHTIKGDSLFVYENVTKIDNPYETNYLASRMNKWNQSQFQNTENMTLFIGDSFFESDNWWTNFYNDYQNKACFTSAIGGTKVTQWLNWIPSLVDPFAANVENIVIHLGYNDVNATQVTAAQLEVHLEDLFARLHSAYPEANIYYFGIGTSYWFQYSGNTRAKATDNLTKAFAEKCDYVTFIDMDLCYKKYMDETGGTLESFFKDGTHPKNENYKYLMAALEEAGCVIANKN